MSAKKKPKRDTSVESAIAHEISACHDDPLRFVETVFPWGEGPLAGAEGPDQWQSDLLRELARQLADGVSPIRMAVASGHGVGKTALSAWLILWFLSTRDHPQLVVTANSLGFGLAGSSPAARTTWG